MCLDVFLGLRQETLGSLDLFKGKPFSITVIQVYVPTSNAEEAEVEQFYEDLQDLFTGHGSLHGIVYKLQNVA